MTRRLELLATRTDGTARIERAERDDPQGRRETDKAAFALLARSDVVSVRVQRVERTAFGARGGTR